MQDGARAHAANVVLNFLLGIFGFKIISCHFLGGHDCGKVWPPNFSDIYMCYFYLWDSGEKLYARKQGNSEP
jgi:hypothetical protein